MAGLATQMAFVSPNVSAQIIEVSSYQDLIQTYQIQGVPKTVVNDRYAIEGSVPEAVFVEHVRRVAELTEEDMERTGAT